MSQYFFNGSDIIRPPSSLTSASSTIANMIGAVPNPIPNIGNLNLNSYTESSSSLSVPTTNLGLNLQFTTVFQGDDIWTYHRFNEDGSTASDEVVPKDEQLSRIGLIKGIMEFSGKFDGSKPGHARSIETEKQRFVIHFITEKDSDEDIFCVMCFNNGHQLGSFASAEYFASVMHRGLKLFELNHGPLKADGDLRPIFSAWWLEFVRNAFQSRPGSGYLADGMALKFDKPKKSSISVPVGLLENLDLKLLESLPKALKVSVLQTDVGSMENYGLIYNYHQDGNRVDPDNELVKCLQFIDVNNTLNRDSLRNDNLGPLIDRIPVVLPSDTAQKRTQRQSASHSFWRDPLRPMVIEPFNNTVDAMASVGNFIASPFSTWVSPTGTPEAASATADSADQGRDVETTPIDPYSKFLTFNRQDGDSEDCIWKVIYLQGQKYKLVVYEVVPLLIVSLVFEYEETINAEELLEFISKELYEIYLSDLKFEHSKKDFQYLIIDKDQYWSSMKLIQGIDREEISLNKFLENFLLQQEKRDVRESMVKLNFKNYWCFYHHNDSLDRQIVILKRLATSSSHKNDDLRNLFVGNRRRARSPQLGAGADDVRDLSAMGNGIEDDEEPNGETLSQTQLYRNGGASMNGGIDDQFITVLGEDVVKFYQRCL